MEEVTSEDNLENILMTDRRKCVLFYASWCPFCRSFLPVFEEYARRYDSAKFLRARIDDEMNPLWEKYDIEVVPTVILFEGGRLVRRLDGKLGMGLSEDQLKIFIEST